MPDRLACQHWSHLRAGACEEEIRKFCKKKRPGFKRVATCLQSHLVQEAAEHESDEDESDFSQACRCGAGGG